MQSRQFNSFLALFLLLSPSWAQARVLVNPPPPYPQKVITDTGFVVSYAASRTGALNTPVNTPRGYRIINTTVSTADANLIAVDVLSDVAGTSSNGANYVVTLSTSTTTGSGIRLTYAGTAVDKTSPTTCSGCQGTHLESAVYAQNQALRLVFSLDDLCASAGSTTAGICAGTNAYRNIDPATPITLSQTIYVSFGVADGITGIGPVSGGEQSTFVLNLTNIAPVVATTCPSAEQDYYFPGDGEIFFERGQHQTQCGNRCGFTRHAVYGESQRTGRYRSERNKL